MIKAALPIPHIIALIIGVIVVAVLAYWFITSSGKGTSIGTEAQCTARKIEFCTTQTKSVLDKAREVCKSDDDFINDAGECGEYCKRIIPTWKSVDTNNRNKCKFS